MTPKLSDCEKNLHICKASCCKVLVFNVSGFMTKEMKDYYLKHGCKLKRISRNVIRVVVPSICNQLDPKTNLCRLHNSPEKPSLCIKLNADTMKEDKFYCTEGCIYGKK